jgi:hypothetical protein
VTLSNTGTAPLTITSVSLTGTNPGDFAQTRTCGASLVAGASCSINVTFKPTAVGARSASLRIISNDPANPTLTVALNGTGAASVAVTPTSLAFGNQTVGTTSAAQTVTLSNIGANPMSIQLIYLNGSYSWEYIQSNNCPVGGSLAPGGSCKINVSFKPLIRGSASASVYVMGATAATSVSIPLGGTGQ